MKTYLKKSAQMTGVMRKTSDKTMNVRFNTNEATSEELAIWDSFAGMTGWLLFAPDSIQDEDIPQEDTEFQTKTPSQRLRGVLFRYFEQQGSNGEFNDFYKTQMETIINHFKSKLD